MHAFSTQRRFEPLIQRYHYDYPLVRDILSILIRDLPKSLQDLEDGITETNAVKVRKAAHSIANISGTVVEIEILEMARKIEFSCVSNNTLVFEIQPLRERIAALCEEAMLFLDTFFEN